MPFGRAETANIGIFSSYASSKNIGEPKLLKKIYIKT